jgi:hypothetical protein
MAYDALDGPEDDQASVGIVQAAADESTVSHHESVKSSHDGLPVLTGAMYALAQSQKEANPPTHTRKNPRHLKPVIPATNARMLPMPQKRVKNMHREWYADLLARILPPLPTKEWFQLRDWAQGRNLPQMIIPRRSNPEAFQQRRHFTKYSALEAIVIQGRIDKAVHGNPEAHRITPRFMRRLWATVFSTCPYMVYSDETNKWSVLWGHHELAPSMLTEARELLTEARELLSEEVSLPNDSPIA